MGRPKDSAVGAKERLQRFGRLIDLLEGSTKKRFTNNDRDAFFVGLSDYPIELIETAIGQFCCSGDWPTVHAIRKICVRLIVGEFPGAEDAYSTVRKAVGKFGYVNPKAAEKFVGRLAWQAVGALGGWDQLCKMQTADSRVAEQFSRAYSRLVEAIEARLVVPESLRSKAAPSMVENTAHKIADEATRRLTDAFGLPSLKGIEGQ